MARSLLLAGLLLLHGPPSAFAFVFAHRTRPAPQLTRPNPCAVAAAGAFNFKLGRRCGASALGRCEGPLRRAARGARN